MRRCKQIHSQVLVRYPKSISEPLIVAKEKQPDVLPP